MSDSIRDAMAVGKGNSLSPEPCALSPDLGYSIHDLTVGGLEVARIGTGGEPSDRHDGWATPMTHTHAFKPVPVGGL